MVLPKPIKRVLLIKSLPPCVTLVLAPVAFVLSILALLAEGTNGMNKSFTVAVNTSTLFENVLKIEPVASATVSRRDVDPMITPSPSSAPVEVEGRQLPGIGEFFSSIDTKLGAAKTSIQSKISTALNPSGTAKPGDLLGGVTGGLLGGGDGLGSLLGKNSTLFDGIPGNMLAGIINGTGSLSTLFDGIPGNTLGSIFNSTGPLASLLNGNGTLNGILNGTGSLSDLFGSGPLGDLINKVGGEAAVIVVGLVNRIAATAVGAIGVQDQYTVYMRDYCSANLTAGTNGTMGPQACKKLREIQGTAPSNSTLQVGNMMIDYSALNIPNKLSGTSGLIKTLFDAIFAFQVIGIVGTGLSFLISIPLVFSVFQLPIPRAIAGVIATLSSVFLTIVTLIEVLVAIAVPMVVNPLAEGLGVEASRSSSFVAFLVVSSVFMEINGILWTLHLYVAWHDNTYVKRTEPKDSDGDDDYVRPLASGRPIIKLNDRDIDAENVTREKALPPMKLSVGPFGRFKGRSRSPDSVRTVPVDDQLPEERLYTRTSFTPQEQQFKGNRPTDRLTIG